MNPKLEEPISLVDHFTNYDVRDSVISLNKSPRAFILVGGAGNTAGKSLSQNGAPGRSLSGLRPWVFTETLKRTIMESKKKKKGLHHSIYCMLRQGAVSHHQSRIVLSATPPGLCGPTTSA